jgi:DNA topoisomerase-2
MEALGLERLAAAQGGDAMPSFRYLLQMAMGSLTPARKRALDAALRAKEEQLARTEATTPEQLWLADLDAFEAAYACATQLSACTTA